MNREANVLYLGNIPYEWNERQVEAVVSQAPNLVELRMGFDYEGKNKGFGFIEFRTPADAQLAIQYLSQIRVMIGPGKFRQFRIDFLKEGARIDSLHKPIIRVDRSMVPPNVVFPDSPPQPGLSQFNPNLPTLPQPPKFLSGSPPPGPPGQGIQTNIQNNNPGFPPPSKPNIYSNPVNSNSRLSTPTPGSGTQGQPLSSKMPQLLLSASQNLPQPQKLPFTTPDVISETLGKIPPAQLIELIANLKDLLSGPNPGRAADVFLLSDNLAPATAQALLMMGFIDQEIIQNLVKNAANQPGLQQQQQQQQQQPHQHQHHQQQQPSYHSPSLPKVPTQMQQRQSGPGIGGPPPQQQFQQQYQGNYKNEPQQVFTRSPQLPNLPLVPRPNHNIPKSNMGNLPPPPPPVGMNYGRNPGNGFQNQGFGGPQTVNLKWGNLPIHTVNKLQVMEPGQADLIAQVLSLPPDQITSLPPDKQTMVSNIRAQYL